jgi:shikimate dehydrogenase
MKTYGLIGWPLGYSWSPVYFAEKFKREEIEAEYREFPIEDITHFPELLSRIPNLGGLNVTIPHKTAVIPFLDDLSPEAAKIGAVNTIQFKNNKRIGHNTDAFGFEKQLSEVDLKVVRGALILGTGGASKAVAFVLNKHNIPFQFVSRNKPNVLAYNTLNQAVVSKFNLIINCTPIGTYPDINMLPPFDVELFSPQTILIDLIYNPEQTSLMAAAEVRGSQTYNGLKMLHFQAERSWEVWQA